MIRINLLTGTVAGGRDGGESVDEEDSGVSTSSPTFEVGDTVTKALALLVPILGFIFYEQFILFGKRREIDSLNTHLKKIESELTVLKPKLDAINTFKQQKETLQNQIKTITEISDSRLSSVRALNAIQDSIPTQAWLTALKFSSDKVDLEGFATDDITVADFMQNIDRSIFFKDVILLKTEERKGPEGTLKYYKVQCSLEGMMP
ncbi:MAG: hypothetical protein COT74_06435 [Bdellovibrionales bacterium CG10_big_fil_rev_8_21_14_0_10_45_34]|nr:MAG: hypothetical protein COT74_06435 [Bdellovibrionales bacterium CG10_big_fil_rev_8_21_14_0_10_45_34]